MVAIGELFIKLKEQLNKQYGEGNWKLRKVSRVRKGSNKPSLTISDELERIGLIPGDYCVIVIETDRLVILKE